MPPLWTRDKCVLRYHAIIQCHCYVQMCVWYGWGKHLTCCFWLNPVVSSRNVIKKLQNCFFSFLTVYFVQFFSEWVHKRHVELTWAPKAHLKQLKNLHLVNFVPRRHWMKHYITLSSKHYMLLLCPFFIMFFARDSYTILMVYNDQIKMHCWHHFKFFCLFMAKQFSPIKHPFLNFNCAPFIIFFV